MTVVAVKLDINLIVTKLSFNKYFNPMLYLHAIYPANDLISYYNSSFISVAIVFSAKLI